MMAGRIREYAFCRTMDSLHNNHPDMQETMQSVKETTELRQWFVMRDLKRGNAKQPAYKLLGELKIRFFTPMVWKLRIRQGKRVRQQVPFMPDLLFVYDSRKVLDPLVEQIATLQYRFVKGGNHQPMTVRNADMERFIRAVDAMNNPCFYTPEEINPDMLGKKVRIVGGLLDGYEGCLQKMQGSRIKRLFVELPNLLTATVEVQPEFIQVLKS
jgi:putative transcriptional regulator